MHPAFWPMPWRFHPPVFPLVLWLDSLDGSSLRPRTDCGLQWKSPSSTRTGFLCYDLHRDARTALGVAALGWGPGRKAFFTSQLLDHYSTIGRRKQSRTAEFRLPCDLSMLEARCLFASFASFASFRAFRGPNAPHPQHRNFADFHQVNRNLVNKSPNLWYNRIEHTFVCWHPTAASWIGWHRLLAPVNRSLSTCHDQACRRMSRIAPKTCHMFECFVL